jgi:hypothetical protein
MSALARASTTSPASADKRRALVRRNVETEIRLAWEMELMPGRLPCVTADFAHSQQLNKRPGKQT